MPTLFRNPISSVRLPFLCCVVALFVGCALPQEEPLIIWGDTPEYVSYVDYYNGTHPQRSAHFRYVSPIFPERIPKQDAPDIIIAQHISYHDAQRAMRAIPQSIMKKIDEGISYETPLRAGVVGKRRNIIPLSFNIPVLILHKNDRSRFSDPLSTTISEIKQVAENMNTYTNGVLTKVGLSPQWNPKLLYIGSVVYGAQYRENNQGEAEWDEGKIFESLRYFRVWNDDIDATDMRRFTDRYIRESLYNRVLEERIGFFVSDLVEFGNVEDERRSSLDFRAIADADIALMDNGITFIGIHKYAQSVIHAQYFIDWILKEETQRELVMHTATYNVDIFGFANGLSTIRNVSVRIIPQYHQWLVGKIPPLSLTIPPPPLPKNWHRMRREVVEPWLQNFLYGTDRESIKNEIIKWQKRENFQ